MRISVAIDGPAGAGKSTIAKILASKLDLMYINTGAMYRAITLKAMEANITTDNLEAIKILLKKMKMHFEKERLIVNGQDVSDLVNLPEVSRNVSAYAAINEVRQELVRLQQDIAKEFNVIMDGRDIGTVVLKDSPFKFFLTASADERALRRFNEFQAKGINSSYEQVLNDIIKRDYDDTHRDITPLVKAEDAIEVDTTGFNIHEVVEKIYSIIKSKHI